MLFTAKHVFRCIRDFEGTDATDGAWQELSGKKDSSMKKLPLVRSVALLWFLCVVRPTTFSIPVRVVAYIRTGTRTHYTGLSSNGEGDIG